MTLFDIKLIIIGSSFHLLVIFKLEINNLSLDLRERNLFI